MFLFVKSGILTNNQFFRHFAISPFRHFSPFRQNFAISPFFAINKKIFFFCRDNAIDVTYSTKPDRGGVITLNAMSTSTTTTTRVLKLIINNTVRPI